ncbi:hypothetical protein NDU88_012086, partial [Pleurodeles waltl]
CRPRSRTKPSVEQVAEEHTRLLRATMQFVRIRWRRHRIMVTLTVSATPTLTP